MKVETKVKEALMHLVSVPPGQYRLLDLAALSPVDVPQDVIHDLRILSTPIAEEYLRAEYRVLQWVQDQNV